MDKKRGRKEGGSGEVRERRSEDGWMGGWDGRGETGDKEKSMSEMDGSQRILLAHRPPCGYKLYFNFNAFQ